MKSPKDMKIIEIDITNICVYQCSNCTRFCGHHQKSFFMEFETFKKAVDSLDGFEGSIGLIGGEPTLHPQFEEFVKYVGSKFPKYEEKDLLYPQKHFMETIQDFEMSDAKPYHNGVSMASRTKGPLLLSVMGEKYAEHYEVIQDNFTYQLLNDHINEIYHDPILVSRKELGIPDDEWEVLRDNCWIQNEWSASITPKGAFFCEVAGTLDMLFDGPGGWEVTSDWWKKDVADFKDQLHWCELCGAACDTYTRNANEETDDASPVLCEKLEKVGSKKLKNGKINKMIIDENGVIAEESKGSTKRFTAAFPYADSYAAKFSMDNSKLFPKAFESVVFLDEIEKTISDLLKENKYEDLFLNQFQITYFIVKNEEDKNVFNKSNSFSESEKNKWIVYTKDEKVAVDNILGRAGKSNEKKIYTAVFSNGILPKEDFVKNAISYIFNPGVLLYSDDVFGNKHIEEWVNTTYNGIFLLFNRIAFSLRGKNIENVSDILDLKNIWQEEKKLPIDENIFPRSISNQIVKGGRYAIYGTGKKSCVDVSTIKGEGGIIACVFDSDIEKQDLEFEGIIIDNPINIVLREKEYDKIIISSYIYYAEMKRTLIELGVKKDDIIFVS